MRSKLCKFKLKHNITTKSFQFLCYYFWLFLWFVCFILIFFIILGFFLFPLSDNSSIPGILLYKSLLKSLEIGFKCIKLQKPALVHSPISYCLQQASRKSVTGLSSA